MAAISQIFHLPLRQTEGFVKSLFSLASLPLPVPCFSTFCRRRRKLKFEVFRVRKGKGEGMVLIVDSSGVKIMGEGEWAKRQKGEGRRKGWIWEKEHGRGKFFKAKEDIWGKGNGKE